MAVGHHIGERIILSFVSDSKEKGSNPVKLCLLSLFFTLLFYF